jgi:hypothetical protein
MNIKILYRWHGVKELGSGIGREISKYPEVKKWPIMYIGSKAMEPQHSNAYITFWINY